VTMQIARSIEHLWKTIITNVKRIEEDGLNVSKLTDVNPDTMFAVTMARYITENAESQLASIRERIQAEGEA
jgi:hypothetical protein